MVNPELQAKKALQVDRVQMVQMVNPELQAIQALKEQPEARALAALIQDFLVVQDPMVLRVLMVKQVIRALQGLLVLLVRTELTDRPVDKVEPAITVVMELLVYQEKPDLH
jgi:hypothetical protein